MSNIDRRKLMVGGAAGVAAVVVSVAPLIAAQEDAYERIRLLTAELEGAMRKAYQTDKTLLLSWGPHNPTDGPGAPFPAVMIRAVL